MLIALSIQHYEGKIEFFTEEFLFSSIDWKIVVENGKSFNVVPYTMWLYSNFRSVIH